MRPIFCYYPDTILLLRYLFSPYTRYVVRPTSIFRANRIVKVSGVPIGRMYGVNFILLQNCARTPSCIILPAIAIVLYRTFSSGGSVGEVFWFSRDGVLYDFDRITNKKKILKNINGGGGKNESRSWFDNMGEKYKISISPLREYHLL